MNKSTPPVNLSEVYTLADAIMLSDTDVEAITYIRDRFSPLLLKYDDDKDVKSVETRSLLIASNFHRAVSYFVHVSPAIDDISRTTGIDADTIRELAKTPEWENAARILGWKGDMKVQERATPNSVPIPLREDFLLKEAFQKDGKVRLVTYDGFMDTHIKKLKRYDIVLESGKEIPKLTVLLAFPQDRMRFVKSGVKRRKSVADKGLKPIEDVNKRPKIEVYARLGSLVECVMRNGLVITGEHIWNSKYNIVMRVGGRKGKNGKVVLIYKHALHAFRVVKEQQKKQPTAYREDWDDFDEES